MPARRIALSALTVLILVLGGVLGFGVANNGWKTTPKLALDLEGGTQVILQAKSHGGEAITPEQMEQARQIISQRINAMGVAETEISVQGGTNIVVNVPGKIDEATSNALRRTATMSFRPVLLQVEPNAGVSDAGGASDGSSQHDAESLGPVAQDVSQTSDGGGESSASAGKGVNTYKGEKAWNQAWLNTVDQEEFAKLDCTDPDTLNNHSITDRDDEAVIACGAGGTSKLILGPVVVSGEAIKDANAGADKNQTGQATGYYAVNLTFNDEAGKAFGEMSSALYSGQGATKQFAIVLDSVVISAPQVQAVTTTQSTITGNFTADQAKELASQLKFGALPLEFTVQSEQQISATLGSDQLTSGLIAGLIGLVLVVIYAAFQYRVLSIVTTASLAIMGVLAYLVITLMSNMPEIGYRLSLAGVAGLIVSIAFTADSFIVYFERVRDEIRDGRGIVAAIDHGWNRAKRTILASDAVNVIAAVVLYLVSAGSVRGFAFTLGLTTILDLLVVFLFTHPLLQSLGRTNFFGKGHPASGLDPALLGRNVPAYAGRARFRSPDERGKSRKKKGSGKGSASVGTETLAERKARLAREAAEGTPPVEAAEESSGSHASTTEASSAEDTTPKEDR
ncbi:protein translocase subunit SecD [Dermabacter sp. p3-SID358]|uniref:protein translocase subunit SecD n=1 Tax=Dermabacter sp. p3-SID358 TaxID=2916114 RepID=UPI0021A5A9BC|nr:protein translocase subunit SecD [Dermabacter sp. p3-SID358]MCT1865936.1 protein translocase subunit SecD [Dermabacter sp. p3-SID358]